MNPLGSPAQSSVITYSEGNLKTAHSGTNLNSSSVATMQLPPSGKYYWEVLITAGGDNYVGVGHNWVEKQNNNDWIFAQGGWSYRYNGQKYSDGTANSYGDSFVAGDLIACAVDVDNSKIYFSKNGVWQNSSNPATSTNPAYTNVTGDNLTIHTAEGSSAAAGFIANFGQDSSFAGNKTAQGNQDGNDIGDFYYTPPTGYLALCTKNLPDVDVVPSENFNTVLYTGNGGTQSITGVGFQPGLTWIKARSEVRAHYHFDEVRGVEKALSFDAAGAEDESSSYLSAFGSDGFSIGNTSTINKNTITYAAWNWKVGGSSGSSNTNGSINTTSTSVNSDAGFSISTYTGNATSGATIGHGLSKTPEVIIVSVRSQAGGHNMYHTAWGSAAKTAPINSYEPSYSNANIWNSTAPGSSVFTIGNNSVVNTDNATFVAYCWHSVEGYSKFGVYGGTGDNDGPFVYCGFRPAFIMLKNSDAYQHYTIYDVKRRTFNPVNTAVYADVTEAESNDSEHNIDILSNGFKIRNNGAQNNTNNNDYMFMAFAETPFKYSNGR